MLNHVYSIIGNDVTEENKEQVLEFVDFLNDGYQVYSAVPTDMSVHYILTKYENEKAKGPVKAGKN